MTRRGQGRFLWLALLLSLLFGRPVRASDALLVLELEHGLSQMPTHMCLVAATGGKAAVALTLLKDWREETTDGCSNAELEVWSFAPVGEDVWSQRVGALRKTVGLDAAALAGAVEALSAMPSASHDDASCESPGNFSCNPRYEIKPEVFNYLNSDGTTEQKFEELHIACTPNRRSPPSTDGLGGADPDDQRVLVALLDFQAPGEARPTLKELRLDGSIARIVLGQASKLPPVVVAGSIGGHYAFGSTKMALDGRILMPIEPRCSLHEVALPPMIRARGGVPIRIEASLEGLSKEMSCAGVLKEGRSMRIRLPHLTSEEQKTLRIIARAAIGPKILSTPTLRPPSALFGANEEACGRLPFHGVFEAHWQGARPPVELRASARQVSFEWKSHCLFRAECGQRDDTKRSDCPNATLAEIGMPCEASYDEYRGTCHYSCPDSPNRNLGLEFDLPTEVRFESEVNNDAWEEQLSYAGELLDGFVPPAERWVEVDFDSWRPMLKQPFLGDRIDHVTITTPAGRRHVIEPPIDGNKRIPVPNAGCQDSFTYKIHGERRFRAMSATIGKGALELDGPGETARVVSYGLTASVGPALARYTLESSEETFAIARPAFELTFNTAIRPFGVKGKRARRYDKKRSDGEGQQGEDYRRSLWFEIDLGGMLYWKQYMPSYDFELSRQVTPNDTPGKGEPYFRMLYGSWALIPLAPGWQVGLGGGSSPGFPIYRAHFHGLGTSQGLPWAGLQLRLKIASFVALRLSARGFHHDTMYVFQSDFRGGIEPKPAQGWMLVGDAGLRFDMNPR